jgi:hypothetical protein
LVRRDSRRLAALPWYGNGFLPRWKFTYACTCLRSFLLPDREPDRERERLDRLERLERREPDRDRDRDPDRDRDADRRERRDLDRSLRRLDADRDFTRRRGDLEREGDRDRFV